MTTTTCDACGREFRSSDPSPGTEPKGEAGETLDLSGFHYDLCDACGQEVFRILRDHAWKPPAVQSPVNSQEPQEGTQGGK